jgi:GNAT superfamily N-acetyltransferase
MRDLLRRRDRALSVLEHPLYYDGGMADEQQSTDRLHLGAVVRPMRQGRQGLLWDPVSQMPPAAREMLRERIIPVATAAFDGTTADFWAQHWSDEQLDRLDVLHVAVDETGTPVGWVSGRRADWGGRRVLYAASAGVAPDIQGGGVSAALWRRVVERELRRAPLQPLFVVLRTGNPLVHDAWVAAAGDPRAVHPRPDTAVPARIQAIARDAAAYLGQAAELDPRRLHITDAYGSTPGGLWRHRPRSRDEQTNAWFDTTLRPTDAFLVVARFHPLTQLWRSRANRRRTKR